MSEPRPKSSVVPPGGFHFVDKTETGEYRVEGSSYEEVANNLLKLRLANGVNPGNPLEEVYHYVCSSWPHFCQSQQQPAAVRSSGPGLSARAQAWIAAAAQQSTRSSPSESEIQRRAAICAGCPQNRDVSGGCGSCIANIRRLAFILTKGRNDLNHLGACDILSQWNPVAVGRSSFPPSSEEQISRLPNYCWRRTT